MGLVIRQSVYSTIISYAGVVVGYLNLLYFYPRFLSLEQVGLFRTFQDAAILFSPFAQFGITQTIFRFYPQLVKDRNSTHSFITLMVMLAVTGFAIFFLIFKIFEAPLLAPFQENAKEIIQYTSLVLWLTLILVLMAVLEAFSRSLLKTVIPNLLREVVARLFLSVLVLLYFNGVLTFDQLILCSVFGYLICLLFLMFYLWRLGELSFKTNFSLLDKSKFPELIRYSLLSFAGMAGLILIGKIDSLMVTAILGTAANAIYTTAFYISTVIEVPKRALSQITMPLIARAFERNDLKEIHTLYSKTSINQFIVGALLLIGIWINIDSMFLLMPKGDQYALGKWVVIIVGAGKLVDMLFGPSSEIIVLSRYYWFNIILIILLAAVVILANNLLIPIYGINGAAIGAAFALVAFNTVKYFFILIKLKVQPFTIDSLKVLGIALLVLGINWFIPRLFNPILDILVRSAVVTLVYASFIFYSNISPEGNNFLKSMLARIGIGAFKK